MYGSSPIAQRLMVLPGRVPQFVTMFQEEATLGEAEEWAKSLHLKALEEGYTDSVLETLKTLINSGFLHQGVALDRVDRNGVWLRDGGGHVVSLQATSDGYRSALGTLMDIYRHMVGTYGLAGLVEEREGVLMLTRPGVVLIDEVDAHLHPSWQREIGFWLKRHCPNLQFVVTTHSPIVSQAADDGRIYHLPQPGEGEAFRLSDLDFLQAVTGRPNEILLGPAFGLPHTRSPSAVSARERRAKLRARVNAGDSLTEDEKVEYEQLNMFVHSDN
jgi:hypothetical protein